MIILENAIFYYIFILIYMFFNESIYTEEEQGENINIENN